MTITRRLTGVCWNEENEPGSRDPDADGNAERKTCELVSPISPMAWEPPEHDGIGTTSIIIENAAENGVTG